MAITIVGTAQNVSTNGGSVSVDLSGLSLQEGDYVAAAGGWPRNTEPTLTSTGYTVVADINYAPGVLGVYWKVWQKKMGATPDTTFVMDGSGFAVDSHGVVVIALRGVDGTTFNDATPTENSTEQTDGLPFDGPSITTATANAVVLSFGFDRNDTGVGSVSSAPSGYSNLIVATGADSRRVTVAGSTKEVASPGEENPGAYTDGYTTESRTEITVAVKAAAAGGGGSTSPNALRINAIRGNLGTNMTTR